MATIKPALAGGFKDYLPEEMILRQKMFDAIRSTFELFGFVPYDLSPSALASGRGYYFYQITARGFGTTNASVANVQSIFAAQFN